MSYTYCDDTYNAWTSWIYTSEGEKQAEWDRLVARIDDVIREQEEEYILAAKKFEKLVTETIQSGAGDRETALRWIMDASDCDGDLDFLCFHHHLPYGYFTLPPIGEHNMSNAQAAPQSYFVARREDGCFLAIDSNSGGYPWYPNEVSLAEKFRAGERAVSYIESVQGDGPFTIHELTLGPAMTLAEFKRVARDDIREAALAKLTPAEREALGV